MKLSLKERISGKQGLYRMKAGLFSGSERVYSKNVCG